MRNPATTIVVLLLFSAALSLAMAMAKDMSIIDYDNKHPSNIIRSDDEIMSIFKRWMTDHGKVYNGIDETQKRFNIFKDNLQFVDAHNSVKRTYKVGLNVFADLTNEEYQSSYLGLRYDVSREFDRSKVSQRYVVSPGEILPDSIDWRKKGAVSPIRYQGGCGSCWAFSAIATVESLNQIVTGKLIDLSEQEVIDCDPTIKNGCTSGFIASAFKFIIKNGGIDTESDYPYLVKESTCNTIKLNKKVVSIDKYENVPYRNENYMKKAVANQPITVSIDSTGKEFQLYTTGIFKDRCGTNLTHAVVVVGYGTENGVDYWIVRNSWSERWGENGYIRMHRNIGLGPFGAIGPGKCGIAMFPSYPVKNTKPTSFVPESLAVHDQWIN